jgi:hypothetical protein
MGQRGGKSRQPLLKRRLFEHGFGNKSSELFTCATDLHATNAFVSIVGDYRCLPDSYKLQRDLPEALLDCLEADSNAAGDVVG